jgi:hypothetical protein
VTSTNAASSLSARGTTFYVEKGQDAALVATRLSNADPPVTVSLVNSIARNEGGSAGSGDLLVDRATLTASSSAYSSVVLQNGGTATAAGSAANVSGDPKLVNPLARDFSLQATSPLIDKGDPSVVTAGELDLAGAARSLDGNGDCAAAPDIGAFERPALVCPVVANASPVVSGFGATNKVFAPVAKGGKITSARKRKRKVKRGTRFRYRLSEAAKVTITIERKLKGRRVKKGKKKTVCAKPTRKNRKKHKCTRYKRVGRLTASKKAGKQTTPFTGRFKGKALKRGRYRATIVATDAQGAKSKPRRLSFRIVKP